MTLPIALEAFEGHAAILGTTGSGKSTLVRSILGSLRAAGRRVATIDKMGNQWGLTLAADGEGVGGDFIVFGGKRAQVPMGPLDGAKCARLVVERLPAAIFDVSQWGFEDQAQWVADFADALFLGNSASLHLGLDEVQSWIPQSGGGVARGSILRLAEQGRGNGIHLLMAAQRVSRIDKTALAQAPLIIAMATLGRIDTRSVVDEVETRVGKVPAGFGDSLSALATGEGWIAYAVGRRIERVRFDLPDTFDSSRTPKHGDAPVPVPVAGGALVDELRALLGGGEPPVENDPASPEPARLTALREKHAVASAEAAAWRAKYLDAMKSIRRARDLNQALILQLDAVERETSLARVAAGHTHDELRPGSEGEGDVVGERVGGAAAAVHRADRAAGGGQEGGQRRHPRRLRRGEGNRVRHQDDAVDHPAAGDGKGRAAGAGGAARDVQDRAGPGGLNAAADKVIALLERIKPASIRLEQAATLAGYSTTGGYFRTAVKQLQASERVIFLNGGLVTACWVGSRPVGLTRAAALAMWREVLPKAAPKLIDAVHGGARGRSVADVAAELGYQPTGGYFRETLKACRDAGVIVDVGDGIGIAVPLPGEST